MDVKIQKAETFDGQAEIELKLGDGTRVYLYLCTTKEKIKGMYKEIVDDILIDIPEQDMPTSKEEWRY